MAFKTLVALTAFALASAWSPPTASAGCASWDIKDTCCLAGCAAKRGSNWSKADEILRGCMQGLGCSEREVGNATVFMKCDCPKENPHGARPRDESGKSDP